MLLFRTTIVCCADLCRGSFSEDQVTAPSRAFCNTTSGHFLTLQSGCERLKKSFSGSRKARCRAGENARLKRCVHREFVVKTPHRVTRRRFLATSVAAGFSWALPNRLPGAPFPVQFRRPHPYESLYQFIEPGRDEFLIEKQAQEITDHLEKLLHRRSLPL